MNERLKPKDSRDELIKSLSGSDCIGLTYGTVTMFNLSMMIERLRKPEDSKQVI